VGYLKKLAVEAGIDPEDAEAVRRMDRKRKKRTSNKDWVNPHDPDAGITKMKDGSTHLAYKAEQAVDLDTGAIVAITTQGGATGDTDSVSETLCAAGVAVAAQIATETSDGKYVVNQAGVEELVTDKGYHSGVCLVAMAEMGVRSYVSEPKQDRRKWKHKTKDNGEEQAAVYANRRRVTGPRGKRLLRRRGEFLERPFAHQYETGGLRRVHVKGREEVAKRVLIQAASCNIALILRTITGSGTPRGSAEVRRLLVWAFHGLLEILNALAEAQPTTGSPRSLYFSEKYARAENVV